MKNKIQLLAGDTETLQGERVELVNGIEYLKAEPGDEQKQMLKVIYEAAKQYKLSHHPLDTVGVPGEPLTFGNMDNTILRPALAVTLSGRDFPDWVIEVATPAEMDFVYFLKPMLYRDAGVKEYWILDYDQKSVIVYSFLKDGCVPRIYDSRQRIKVSVYSDLFISYSDIFAPLGD